MKRTDLEKLKAKQLGNRLARERATHGGNPGERGGAGTGQPASELVQRLLRGILEKK